MNYRVNKPDEKGIINLSTLIYIYIYIYIYINNVKKVLLEETALLRSRLTKL